MEETTINQTIDALHYIFDIKVPEDFRRSILNTIIISLRDLYNIEEDNGCWDREMKTKHTNAIIDTLISELSQLKYID